MEAEYSINPLHDYGFDQLGLSHGQILQKDLGLSNFRNNVYIQKVIGYTLPIYLISYNSKYPHVHMGLNKVKNIKSTWVGKIKVKAIHISLTKIKLTPPIQLNASMVHMVTGSIVIMRDIAGEFLRDKRVFECIENNNKLKLVESK